MARYIDADRAVELICNGDGTPTQKLFAECCVLSTPTADVAPKSEVVSILDKLMEEARAIADRYEKTANEISDFEFERIEFRGCQMGALLVLFKIAELKKKYTGEQI